MPLICKDTANLGKNGVFTFNG